MATQPPKTTKRRRLLVWALAGLGVLAPVLLVALRIFVFESFKIPSGGMSPTLLAGDYIFVDKTALEPERAAIMVFEFPESREQDFIKRVVALPGDTIEALDGRPIVNGVLAPHCYVGTWAPDASVAGTMAPMELYLERLGDRMFLTVFDQKPTQDKCTADHDCGGSRACRHGVCGLLQGPWKLSAGEVWMMGDNRNNSHDSRMWNGGTGAGAPLDHLKGTPVVIWTSIDPRGGNRWDRFGVGFDGAPVLPTGASASLKIALQSCLKSLSSP